MAVDYKTQAQSEIDAQVNPQIQVLKNALAQKLAGYNNQKASLGTQYQQATGDINKTFDGQVNNQNLMNVGNKNNISNTVLGRGLARSTIATSGLGEADQINTRKVGDINTSRISKLNDATALYNTNLGNIDNTIASATAEEQNNEASLMANRQNLIAQLTRQLENDAWDKNYKMLQFNKSSGGSGYSGGSGSKPKTSTQLQADAKKANAAFATSKANVDELMNMPANDYPDKDKRLVSYAQQLIDEGDVKGATYAKQKAAQFADMNKNAGATLNSALQYVLKSAKYK